jgi:DNA (cytosine-5)-methyltransferase 1
MNGQPLRYLSLFSGIGGFDLGFDRAGMTCAGQVEFDAAARSVLERHWPDVPRLNDVREVNGDEFGSIDLICGGFPCQDVSVAGRRAGLAGERSGLWYEFHRLIDAVKPGIVVIENVPGLLSSNGGADFAVILRGLVECGYGVAWRILDAQYFGVAQRRRRVFIVGSLGSGRAAEVLFEREGGAGDIAESRQAGAGIAHAVTGSSVSSSYRYDPNGEELIVTATLNSGGNKGGFRTEPSEHLVAVPLRAEGHDASEDGTGRQNLIPVLAFTERTRPDGRTFEAQEDLAYALTNPGSGGRTHSRQIAGAFGVRRLTPVECERLQGFPDEWTAAGWVHPSPEYIAECARKGQVPERYVVRAMSDSTRYRQMGNAVAVPVAEWLGRRIVAAKQQEKPQ